MSYTFCDEILAATGVEIAATGHVTVPRSSGCGPNLVVARNTQLEIYSLVARPAAAAAARPGDALAAAAAQVGYALRLEAAYGLFGSPTAVATVPLDGMERDCVLVTYARAKVAVLEWDAEAHYLQVVSLHVYEDEQIERSGLQRSFVRPRLVLDPQHRMAAVWFAGDQVVVIPFRVPSAADFADADGGGGAAAGTTSAVLARKLSPVLPSFRVDLRQLSLLDVRDMAFVHDSLDPTLLLLHVLEPAWAARIEAGRDTCGLSAVTVNAAQKSAAVAWSFDSLPYDSFGLAAVPRTVPGGVFVLSNNLLIYFNQSTRVGLSLNALAPPEAYRWPGLVRSHIPLSLDRARWTFLEDDTLLASIASGELYAFHLVADGRTVNRIGVCRIGISVPASELLVLREFGQHFLFLGSRLGDSLLMRVEVVQAAEEAAREAAVAAAAQAAASRAAAEAAEAARAKGERDAAALGALESMLLGNDGRRSGGRRRHERRRHRRRSSEKPVAEEQRANSSDDDATGERRRKRRDVDAQAVVDDIASAGEKRARDEHGEVLPAAVSEERKRARVEADDAVAAVAAALLGDDDDDGDDGDATTDPSATSERGLRANSAVRSSSDASSRSGSERSSDDDDGDDDDDDDDNDDDDDGDDDDDDDDVAGENGNDDDDDDDDDDDGSSRSTDDDGSESDSASSEDEERTEIRRRAREQLAQEAAEAAAAAVGAAVPAPEERIVDETERLQGIYLLSEIMAGDLSTDASQDRRYKFTFCDRLLNVGPIVDVCLVESMDPASVSLAQYTGRRLTELVACGGLDRNGALYSLQRGIRPRLNNRGYELPGYVGVWTLKRRHDDDEDAERHSFMLLSKEDSTTVLRVGSELEEVQETGFEVAVATLNADSVCGFTRIVQVVSDALVLLDGDRRVSRMSLTEYGTVLTASSVMDPYVCLVFDRTLLVCVEADTDELRVVQRADHLSILALSLFRYDGAAYVAVADEEGTLKLATLPAFDCVFSCPHFSQGAPMLINSSFTRGGDVDSGSIQSMRVREVGRISTEMKETAIVNLCVATLSDVPGSEPFVFALRVDDSLLAYRGFRPAFAHPPRTQTTREVQAGQLSLRFQRMPHRFLGAGAAAVAAATAQEEADEYSYTRQRLSVFESVGGRRALCVSGDEPLWVFCPRNGMRVFPMDEDALIGCAPLNIPNCRHGFVYYTKGGELKIAEMSRSLSVELEWISRKVPLRETPKLIRFHAASRTVALVVERVRQVYEPPNPPVLPTSSDRLASQNEGGVEGGGGGGARFAGGADTPARTASGASEPGTADPGVVGTTSSVPPLPPRPQTEWTLPFPMDQSELQLVMPDTWQVIDRFVTDDYEKIVSVEFLTLENKSKRTWNTYLVVGLGVLPGEDGPAKGRIMIYDVLYYARPAGATTAADRKLAMTPKLRLLFATKKDTMLRAPVTAVASMRGYLLVALASKVMMYSFDGQMLTAAAFWDGQFFANTCTTLKDVVLLNDVYKGAVLVRWKESMRQLLTLGRDIQPQQSLQAELLLDGGRLTVVNADREGNLHSLYYAPNRVESRGGEVLLVHGDFHLGAHVNRMLAVPTAESHAGQVSMALWITTCEGSMHTLLPIDEHEFRMLGMLQTMLISAVPHVSGLNPQAFRTLKSPQRMLRNSRVATLDGRLLWAYASFDAASQNALAQRIGVSRYEVLDVIQRLAYRQYGHL